MEAFKIHNLLFLFMVLDVARIAYAVQVTLSFWHIRYAQYMPNICPIHAQYMSNTCPRYAQDMPEIYPRYAQYMPEKYAKKLGQNVDYFYDSWGKMSLGQNVSGAKCPWGKMSPSRPKQGSTFRLMFSHLVTKDHVVLKRLLRCFGPST